MNCLARVGFSIGGYTHPWIIGLGWDQLGFPSRLYISVTLQPGGGVLPYIGYIGMCRPKGYGFLSRFGLKTGIDIKHFGLKLGMVI